jgi:hypothetical protein
VTKEPPRPKPFDGVVDACGEDLFDLRTSDVISPPLRSKVFYFWSTSGEDDEGQQSGASRSQGVGQSGNVVRCNQCQRIPSHH